MIACIVCYLVHRMSYASHSPEWVIVEAKSVIVGAWSGHEQVVVSIAPEPYRVPAAAMDWG